MKSIHESDDSNYSRNGERMHPEKNPPIRKMTADELRRRYEKELRAMDRNPPSFSDISDLDTCSATDCTGLIPSLPQSEAEREAYDDIHHLLPKIPSATDTP